MTAGRTYLSIGDVLTLLRQEFPDVTISKIRFLESQGLVNPERTPSGYRKFYDHDVERLRWVLRQQREHFLPLKVIKGRLDDSTPEESVQDAAAPAESAAIQPADLAQVSRTPQRAEPALARENGAHLVDAPGIVENAGAVAVATRAAQPRRTKTTGAGSYAGDASGQLPGFDPGYGRERLVTDPVGPGQPAGSQDSERRPVMAATAKPQSGSAGGAGRHLAGRSMRTQVPEVEEPESADLPLDDDEVPDHSGQAGPRRLTASELAQASGLSESDVEELGSYGILGGRSVGGVVHYGQSDVAIAELAAGFARFGIEPRHLRMYKHAADRESGFVEQLVLPLLKQRNPEARKRASEMASELTRLGQGLRAAMVRRGLQDLLGG